MQTAIHIINPSLYLALHIVDGYRANNSTGTLRRSGNANARLTAVHTTLIMCLDKYIISMQGTILNHRSSIAIDGIHYNGSANAHAGAGRASAGQETCVIMQCFTAVRLNLYIATSSDVGAIHYSLHIIAQSVHGHVGLTIYSSHSAAAHIKAHGHIIHTIISLSVNLSRLNRPSTAIDIGLGVHITI